MAIIPTFVLTPLTYLGGVFYPVLGARALLAVGLETEPGTLHGGRIPRGISRHLRREYCHELRDPPRVRHGAAHLHHTSVPHRTWAADMIGDGKFHGCRLYYRVTIIINVTRMIDHITLHVSDLGKSKEFLSRRARAARIHSRDGIFPSGVSPVSAQPVP